MGAFGSILLLVLIGAVLYWLGDAISRHEPEDSNHDSSDESSDDDFDLVAIATAAALALGGLDDGEDDGDINLTGLDASEPVGMSMMLDMGEL